MKSLLPILLITVIPFANAVDLEKAESFNVHRLTLKEATKEILQTAFGEKAEQFEIVVKPTEIILEIKENQSPLPDEFKHRIGEFLAEVSSPRRISTTLRDLPTSYALKFIAQQANSTVLVSSDHVTFYSQPQKVIIDSFESEDPEDLVRRALSLMYSPRSDHPPASFEGRLMHYSEGTKLYVIGDIGSWSLIKKADQGGVRQ